jgi:hypothetical protein
MSHWDYNASVSNWCLQCKLSMISPRSPVNLGQKVWHSLQRTWRWPAGKVSTLGKSGSESGKNLYFMFYIYFNILWFDDNIQYT